MDYCKEMLAKAEEKGVKLLLPVDTTIAAAVPRTPSTPPSTRRSWLPTAISPRTWMGLDIGPKTHGAVYAEAVTDRQDRRLERSHGRL